MKKTNFFVTAGGALLSAGAFAAQAETPTGAYFGLLGGSTAIERDIDEDVTYKTDKMTWGALLGWQFNNHIGAEVSYVKPQNIRESAEIEGDTHVFSGKLHGLTASAIASWPMTERLSIHARIGAVRVNEKYSLSINGISQGSASDETTEVLYGGGFGYTTQAARFRLEYQRAEFDYGNFGLVSISLAWFLHPLR